MNYEIKKDERRDELNRAVEFMIDGRPRVTVSQSLRSPVDFKPCPPAIAWSAPHQPDADLAEAVGHALIEAAEIYRQWAIETGTQQSQKKAPITGDAVVSLATENFNAGRL